MATKSYTIHLAKSDVVNFEDVLTDNACQKLKDPFTQIIDNPKFADGSRLYVFVSGEYPPSWIDELRPTFSVAHFTTNSSCAVLAYKTSGRFFVLTFGHGWQYLNESNIEGEFGLRVAINTLDDKKLKRLERANLGDALRGIAQSPFQRDFRSFGTDDALDLIRKIGGKSKSGSGSDSMTGSKSLKLTGEFTLHDIQKLSDEALLAFTSVKYKDTSFKVIDFVSPVFDRRLIETLDGLAAAEIRNKGNSVELGLPAEFDEEGISFRFKGPGRRGSYADLLLRNYYEAMGDNIKNFDVSDLRKHHIVATYAGPAKIQKPCSLRNALIGSLQHGGGLYAINDGEWYRVDEAFKDDIERSFKRVKRGWKTPPGPLHQKIDPKGNSSYESEADYNTRIALDNGFVCMDRRLITIPGVERSSFEACDLLDITKRKFIHVKKSSRRSSVLSHFFKQGSNSAQNFARFPDAWDQLGNELEKREGKNIASSLRNSKHSSSNRWSVEFWIADSPHADGEFRIPFFSRISLRDEVRSLQAMQYKVALRFIELQPVKIK